MQFVVSNPFRVGSMRRKIQAILRFVYGFRCKALSKITGVEAMLRRESVATLGTVRSTDRETGIGEDAAWRSLLYRGASGAFVVQVGGAGLGLVVHIFLARYLGVAQYGVYTLVLSWVGVFSVFALFGQGTGVIRLVPAYVHRENWGELRGLRRGTGLIVFLTSGFVVLAGALVIYLLRARLGETVTLTFFAGLLLLPLLVQLQLNGAFLAGFKRAGSSGAFNSLLRPVMFMALLSGAALVFGDRLDASIAMYASVIAVFLTLACSSWFLRRVWPAQGRGARPSHETRKWLRLGRQLFFLAFIGIVLNRVDVLVLGGFVGAEAVGPYYAAVQLAAIALYGLNAVNTILAPMIAECYAAGNHATLSRLVHRAAWLTFAVTATVSLAAAIGGRWVLELFGSGFSVAYVPLLIILGGQCVNASTGPVGFLMTMTRFEAQAPWIFGGGAVLNLLLSILLIPSLGIVGAAIAIATATIAWNLAALVFVRRKLGVNPTIFPFPVR